MNKTTRLLLITVLFMLVLPWGIVSLTQSMAMLFVLLYVGNPIYSAYLGYQCGIDIKKRWYIPMLSSFSFLLGVLIMFESKEASYFYRYSFVYLTIGVFSMLFSYSRNQPK